MLRSKPVVILMLSFAVTLTACSSMMDTSGRPTGSETLPLLPTQSDATIDRLPSVICSAFGPLSWSAQDTRQTVFEVKRHNAKWLRVCDPEKYGELSRGQDEKL